MSVRRAEHARDPTTQPVTPRRWRRILADVRAPGANRLEAVGVTLVLGFLLGALALYVFSDVAEGVAGNESQGLDQAVLAWLQGFANPQLDSFAVVMSTFGTLGVTVLLVVVLVVLGLQRRWGAAGSLVLVTTGAQLLNNILKELFHRTRPASVGSTTLEAQQWSFPSGHAMVSAAFYLYIAYLCWQVLDGGLRRLVCGGLLVLVLLIGLSRLYLGVHYVTDVVAGYLAGFIWADSVIIAGYLLTRPRG